MIELDEDPTGATVDRDEVVKGYSARRLPMLRYHLEKRRDSFNHFRKSILESLDQFRKDTPDVALFKIVSQLQNWKGTNEVLNGYIYGLLELLKDDGSDGTGQNFPQVTDGLVAAFIEAYAVPGYEQPDPERVRQALNTALKSTDASVVVGRGFIVRGDSNQSDGLGPSYEVGRYETLEEARKASRGKGVQGDPGTVDRFETALTADGKVKTQTKRLIARRRTPEGSYLVGFLDFREYEFGLRPADLSPVRPAPTSILAADKFALGEAESLGYPVVAPLEVRETMLGEPGVWIGLWRRAGDIRWRGEFEGSSEKRLDRYLPGESILKNLKDGALES